MREVLPPTPGEALGNLLKHRNISLCEFAEQLGLRTKDIEDVVKGRKVLDGDLADNLESLLQIRPHYWVTKEKIYQKAMK